MKFFFDEYSFTSAGAIAALVQGLVAKELWRRGLPRALAGTRARQPARARSAADAPAPAGWRRCACRRCALLHGEASLHTRLCPCLARACSIRPPAYTEIWVSACC
jgi:hypothetical protein